MQTAETYITSCHRVLSRVSCSDALVVTPRLLRQGCQACSANLPVWKSVRKPVWKTCSENLFEKPVRKTCLFGTCGKHVKCTFVTLIILKNFNINKNKIFININLIFNINKNKIFININLIFNVNIF